MLDRTHRSVPGASPVVLRLTLLRLVKCRALFHQSEQAASGVALEAATDFGVGRLLDAPAGEVVLGRLMAVDHSPVQMVQSPVERAVTESVEPVPLDPTGRGFQRADARPGGGDAGP